MKAQRFMAVIDAILAAVFYAFSIPLSKLLLVNMGSTYLASFLYLGAGVGVGLMYAFHWKNERKSNRLGRSDLPYTLAMIVLDIAAPIFLMLGVKYGHASNASLLGNFEIVMTTLIALLIFKEKVSVKLWLAIGLISLASLILSFEGQAGLTFSLGSLFVLLATSCWGLENNCTRSISDKSTYQIVVLKGLGSGLGSLIVAKLMGEDLPNWHFIFLAMLLGYLAYGLSIFVYIRAQSKLGAAKTSAYYAIAPFIGAGLSFILLGDKLSWQFVLAFVIMVIGIGYVLEDTLGQEPLTNPIK